jgi:predicted RNase H-like nuclease (RuvC/YqgF family)
MLNINHSHNVELMNKSEALRGYSVYISKFREYNENRDTGAEQAAVMALDYCINNNIMAAFFKEHGKEVIGMVLDFTQERASEFIGKLEKEIEQKQLDIDAKERVIESKEREIESKEREIESKERVIESKEREIESKEREIGRLSRLLEEHGISTQE